jgi:solute carrier family 35, member C2
MVPMSIAGIAKEVATISVSSFFFHDKLTALNFLGVAITICGSFALSLIRFWYSDGHN